MPEPGRRKNEQDDDAGRAAAEDIPGAVGYPEPGSGHDASETVTVEDGPPIEKVDGVPGATGEVEIERQQ